MSLQDIVALMLFILPGILAEKISHRMDMPSHEKRSDFKEIINGVLLSLPIVILVGIIICTSYEIWTISEFVGKFDDIVFLGSYMLLTLTISIIIGVAKGLLKDPLIKVVNWIRNDMFGKIKIDDKSCWRNFLLDVNKERYLKVTIKGVEKEGFAYLYSGPNEEKEIVLENPENSEDYPEVKDMLKRVNLTYINLEKSIIIEDYDTSEMDKHLKKLKNDSNL